MRVLVADNDARVRSALQTVLKEEPGLTLIGESADLESLATQIRVLKPDLVLLDWDLRGRPAAALLLALTTLKTQTKVIVLSGRPESEEAALAAGAEAFVSKGDPPEVLLTVFRGVIRESRPENP